MYCLKCETILETIGYWPFCLLNITRKKWQKNLQNVKKKHLWGRWGERRKSRLYRRAHIIHVFVRILLLFKATETKTMILHQKRITSMPGNNWIAINFILMMNQVAKALSNRVLFRSRWMLLAAAFHWRRVEEKTTTTTTTHSRLVIETARK